MALEAKLGLVAFEVELDSVVLVALEAKLGSMVGGAEPLLEVGRAEPRLEVDSGWLGVLEVRFSLTCLVALRVFMMQEGSA
ncbi:uncharacterized protein IUM83_17329 [Phytophthora cinnamomi]|uniref:uncharacterized protein n=1 Tax=Phytophthora cinnamomi TaxID=4785 RepID=UPI00355AA6D9|nr:hypothetical protein IUM83_17329 [Phytophthora cinnamomi]